MPRRPQHPSYRLHRRQVAWQIILPIVLAALVVIGVGVLVSLSALRGTGDVSRWAAISTIWLVIPTMFMGLLMLAGLIAVAYLLGRVMGFIPRYTFQAQRLAYRVEDGTRRVTQFARRPTTLLAGIGGFIKRGVGAGARKVAGAIRGNRG